MLNFRTVKVKVKAGHLTFRRLRISLPGSGLVRTMVPVQCSDRNRGRDLRVPFFL
jgi:hypothetical protein